MSSTSSVEGRGLDIIGDVHGCLGELRTLLEDLGWALDFDDAGRAVGACHPQGRLAVFVGDLVDPGPTELRPGGEPVRDERVQRRPRLHRRP